MTITILRASIASDILCTNLRREESEQWGVFVDEEARAEWAVKQTDALLVALNIRKEDKV